jgi:3-dehydroquinate dehydratase type I
MRKKPKICAVISKSNDRLIEKAGREADLFEIRIDLLGEQWPATAGRLNKPWIATNRSISQHGGWKGTESQRLAELLKAIKTGAWMIDIELDSKALPDLIGHASGTIRYMISYHDWEGTPSLPKLREITDKMISLNAYACKIVTTATTFEDNMVVLELIRNYPKTRIISFAMGPLGILSRVISPLTGAYFTYASLDNDSATAPGQITAGTLRALYGLLE